MLESTLQQGSIQKTTEASVSSESYGDKSKQELIGLFSNDDFLTRYLKVSLSPQSAVIAKLQDRPRQQAGALLQDLIYAEAAKIMGETSVDAAKKRGKEFGEARRKVTSVTFKGLTYPLNPSFSNEEFTIEAAKEFPVSADELSVAERAYSESMNLHQSKIDSIRQDLATRADDSTLTDSFDVWGASPNAEGSLNDNEQGYNAGVVHFFEYRADQEKSGRFAVQDTEMSIDAFIRRSEQLDSLLQNYETDPEVEKYALIEDTVGQERLYVLTKKEFIVAFKKKGERMRVITVLPGSKSFDKIVQSEVGNTEPASARLNKLGSHRILAKKSP